MHGRCIERLAPTKQILGEGELLTQGNPTPASAIDAMRLGISRGNAPSTLAIHARRKGTSREIAQANQRVTEPMVPEAVFASCAVSSV